MLFDQRLKAEDDIVLRDINKKGVAERLSVKDAVEGDYFGGDHFGGEMRFVGEMRGWVAEAMTIELVRIQQKDT